MPMDMRRYPPNWKAISLRIRERDGWRCKWCGVPGGVWIVRNGRDGYTQYTHAENMRDGSWHAWNEDADGPCSEIYEFIPADGDGKPVKVILTVAHLGTALPDGSPGNKHNKLDCRDENLAALCQACHLRFDIAEHVHNAAITRRQKKIAAGQQELEIDV